MELTVLGSGGSRPTPVPTCGCERCAVARDRGPPYARGGNALYCHDIGAVVDLPGTLRAALNRERIDRLDYCLLTHWHPDHVEGWRTLGARDATAAADGAASFVERYRETAPTLVTTERVYERACDLTGLDYFVEDRGFVDRHFLDDGPLRIGEWTVRAVPYALADDGDRDATAFLLRRDAGAGAPTTVVLATDDARYLDVDRLPSAPDLAVFECGLFERGPDGEPLLTDADRAVLADELTHSEVRERIAALDPERTLLTEIGHQYGRSHDDYAALAATSAYDGIEFARDGLTLSV